ncbi:MAG: DUF4845 domain-containing protein [Betaproteobacteria bacterium]|nr:DUF4845 domain-containing protein [Betaproteobacteria bacterium]
MHTAQRGLGLLSFILFSVAAVFIAITAMKVIPAYLDDWEIQRAFTAIVTDPSLKNAAESQIRDAFVQRSKMDNITSISPDEIKIDQTNNQLILSARYHVEKSIIGNFGFYINFTPSASSGLSSKDEN